MVITTCDPQSAICYLRCANLGFKVHGSEFTVGNESASVSESESKRLKRSKIVKAQ